jgi:simple sugar transport system substrate-binding protein
MSNITWVQKTLGSLALVASASLMAATNPSTPMKVGFIYLTPVGDIGWTYQHDQGRKQMEEALKGKVTTTVVDSVPETADCERVIREMAKSGVKVIFATSFGYMNPIQRVAKLYPDVVFMHATGYKTAPNVGVYDGRFDRVPGSGVTGG